MEVDIDLLFYFYCVKMGLSEQEYWRSPLKKVLKLIDLYADEQSMIQSKIDQTEYHPKYFPESDPDIEVKEITSMKEMEGWI